MARTKILIVEDNREVSDILTLILSSRGYEVAAAYDGIDGLNQVVNFGPKLIILDVNMPRLDGWQLLEQLKASPITRAIPVVMCTDRSLIKEVELSFGIGADGYIVKPFVAEQVLSKVKDILDAPHIP